MKNEMIAVVSVKLLFENMFLTQGVFDISTQLINNIKSYVQSYPRYLAEKDENYKQIVSYFVCLHDDQVFLTQRKNNCSENLLKNKFSIGIGGHLNMNDLEKDFVDWGLREFEEEVLYTGEKKITPFKIINDNSNIVGRVHLGIVYLVELYSPNIVIKNELKSGNLVSHTQLFEYEENCESWTKLLLPYL